MEQLEGECGGFRVYALEAPLAAFPQAFVEGFPEVVRDFAVPTPVADGLSFDAGETHSLLREWEKLIQRMGSHWPPSNWYSAEMYREDLEGRAKLDALLAALPGEQRASFGAALAALDARFRDLTVDGGAGAAAAPAPWYWRRRPVGCPWE
ncbi:hypothetical protein ACFWBF_35655 [Streptomyces sp. NPDC060028]|uniref:hypothetical protein n=1 Tax=Streptomyces sp. NPDC060028 TaxID=3347041 RepID=UPI0036AA3704